MELNRKNSILSSGSTVYSTVYLNSVSTEAKNEEKETNRIENQEEFDFLQIKHLNFENFFQIEENLDYEDSEARLIYLGAIFAFCQLVTATAFILIVFRLYGKYMVMIH